MRFWVRAECKETEAQEERMVDFEYWLDGVVGTCESIESESELHKVWIDGDDSITSIYDYDELYEQITGDLLFDTSLREFAARIGDEATMQTLAGFSQALKTLDQSIEANQELRNPAALLSSREWATFRESARQVVELPYSQPYRNA